MNVTRNMNVTLNIMCVQKFVSTYSVSCWHAKIWSRFYSIHCQMHNISVWFEWLQRVGLGESFRV